MSIRDWYDTSSDGRGLFGWYPGNWQSTGGTQGLDRDVVAASQPFFTGANTLGVAAMAVGHFGATAGTKCRIGLYAVGSNFYPSTLVRESVELDLSGTGTTIDDWSSSFAVLASNATYWMTVLVSSTVNLQERSDNGDVPYFGWSADLSTAACGLTSSLGYGNLPATFPNSNGGVTKLTSPYDLALVVRKP